MNHLRWISPVIALTLANPVFGDSEPTVEIHTLSTDPDSTATYQSPYEQRINTLQHQPVSWLQLYGIAELEKSLHWQKPVAGSVAVHYDRDRSEHTLRTLQLGAYAEWNEHLSAVVVLESEYAKTGYNRADEAYVTVAGGGLALNAGLMYYPIALVHGHFITPPLLEFAETRQPGAMLTYTWQGLSLGGFIYEGEADHSSKNPDSDWGFNAHYVNRNGSLHLTASYIADIADSEGQLLLDQGNRYGKRVGAYGASALYGWRDGMAGEVTAEMVVAAEDMPDMPAGLERPASINLELAVFPAETWQFAWRYEESRDLADAPARRYGVGMGWQFMPRLNLAAEFMRSKFNHRDSALMVTDKHGDTLQERYTLTTQLTLIF